MIETLLIKLCQKYIRNEMEKYVNSSCRKILPFLEFERNTLGSCIPRLQSLPAQRGLNDMCQDALFANLYPDSLLNAKTLSERLQFAVRFFSERFWFCATIFALLQQVLIATSNSILP